MAARLLAEARVALGPRTERATRTAASNGALRGPQPPMPDHQIFGGILRSPLPFPELPPALEGPPTWTLTRTEGVPNVEAGAILGRESVEPGIEVILSRVREGWRLAFDDTGSFDFSPDGATIAWSAPAGVDLEAVRKDVLGRVLPLSLHLQGILCLHGSAVALGSHAVAFVAPKFHGKSTTAAALVETGALLLADDVIPIRGAEPPVVLPSVGFLQLWKDAADRVATGAEPVPGTANGPKVQRRWSREGTTSPGATPLAAVYLLTPAGDNARAEVSRTRLSSVQASLALLGQLKLANLLGVEERGRLLGVTGELAERISVYRLTVPKGLDRIHELTSALRHWHGAHLASRPAS